MALKKLIDGQVLKIDNHSRGRKFEWGKGVHIHKRMNKDRFSGAEVLIPLTPIGDPELEFRNCKGANSSRIEKEIRDAFKNRSIVADFIGSFYKALKVILDAQRMSPDEQLKAAEEATDILVKLFDLDAKVNDKFRDNMHKVFVEYSSPDKSQLIFLADFKEKAFLVGQSVDAVRDFERNCR